ILTIHDVVFLNQKSGLRRWILWLFWVYLPVWQAGLITVISKASADELKAQIPHRWHHKIRIVPNCVDPNLSFQPKARMPKQPRILLIGTKPNKNLARQLEALRPLTVGIHLIGHENQSLRDYLTTYPNPVQWDQGVSDEAMRQAYIDSDLLLFASLEEGFGLPILEAQAVGRPVITSNRSSMPEVAGLGACLVNPSQVEDIRSAVERITQDAIYCKQLVESGYQNVQTYSAQKVAQSYVNVYQELLAKT
ncbi:MAG: glycosyltransferase, partial [Bacteroidota bacterium]